MTISWMVASPADGGVEDVPDGTTGVPKDQDSIAMQALGSAGGASPETVSNFKNQAGTSRSSSGSIETTERVFLAMAWPPEGDEGRPAPRQREGWCAAPPDRSE